MNKNQFQLSIPAPCSMPWEEMQSVDSGNRHCSSCNKVITDFTVMSDEEVVQFFLKNKRACGKLREDQQNRSFIPLRAKKNNFAFRQLLLFPSFLLGVSATAQVATKPKQSGTIVSPSAKKQSGVTLERLITVKGHVTAPDSIKPVRTVIQISNGRDTIRKFSGLDGNYAITIPCFSTDSLVVMASESSDFKKAIKPIIGNDTIICNIHFEPALPIFDTITVGVPRYEGLEMRSTGTIERVTSGDIAMDFTPHQKTRRFFYRLFHPFRFRKNR